MAGACPPKGVAIGAYSSPDLARLADSHFDVLSTMAKCGMVMPREVAISSPGSGWEAVAGTVKLSSNVVKQ